VLNYFLKNELNKEKEEVEDSYFISFL